jgi:hypothetical protein
VLAWPENDRVQYNTSLSDARQKDSHAVAPRSRAEALVPPAEATSVRRATPRRLPEAAARRRKISSERKQTGDWLYDAWRRDGWGRRQKL